MKPRRLTRGEARRIAIKAQLLDANRPADLVKTVERLMFLQLDPTSEIAPSADLIAWSRMGGAYDPAHLKRATEVDRTLFEHVAPTIFHRAEHRHAAANLGPTPISC